MKLNFTIADCRLPIAGFFKNRNSQFAIRKSEKGIALVLTLILLSVTLIMAVAFLFISRREQGSVTTQTDAATARYAADSALAKAQAQIAANILAGAQPNPYNYGLLVSTNFINPYGFQPGLISPTNVNFDFEHGGGALSQNDFLTMLASNLFYDPRPPVYFPSTTNANVYNDFRFYLDLNRNGRYDTNGVSGNFTTNSSGQLVYDGTDSLHIGDPEWIGVLERPDEPYGPNNHFVARYAYIAIPIGNTLDLNAIHNEVFEEGNLSLNSTVNPAQNLPANVGKDFFFRNQGVGSWEINLAAFLADLNTNAWDNNSSGGTYQYNWPNLNQPSTGAAFDDARALLAYRYNNDYRTLAPANLLFFNTENYPSNVDVYSDGGLQMTINTNYFTTIPFPLSDNLGLPFAGADNTNHFFDLPSDLFDPTKSSPGFVSRLSNAGTNGSTYDRYTFYRLLSQLGTDSAPESGKMNLNYDNLDAAGNVIPGAETNFIPWTNSIKFFTNAADRLLRAYTARWATIYTNDDFGIARAGLNTNFVNTFQVTNSFGIGDIPVYVSNRFVYTPAVNRLLQLAANIYDATQTNFYPHIFRPTFWVTNGINYTNVFINGYETVTVPLPVDFSKPPFDKPAELTSLNSGAITNANVYGVPWIIGAKKGFPNFNQFVAETAVTLGRKLEMIRDTNTSPIVITSTNQMYIMSISNQVGVECWNSYSNNYSSSNTITICAQDYIYLTLSNFDASAFPVSGYTNVQAFLCSNTIAFYPWAGSGANLRYSSSVNPNSFKIPLNMTAINLPDSFYYYGPGSHSVSNITFNGPTFVSQSINPSNYWDTGIQPLPHFSLFVTNRLQVIILDGTNIIDYTQLGGLDSSRDIYTEMADRDQFGFWSTNIPFGDTPQGVINQILYSENGSPIPPTQDFDPGDRINPNFSSNIPGLPSYDINLDEAQQKFFKAFLTDNSISYTDPSRKTYTIVNRQSEMQAPYSVSRTTVECTSWQANDPLVHYLASDLSYSGIVGNFESGLPERGNSEALTNILAAALNSRYQPWGRPEKVNDVDTNPRNPAFKDPLVYQSDDWNFPTNVLPAVGWLGRIHRGTPWQTVFLKSTNILDWTNNVSIGQTGYNTWINWTGDGIAFDLTNSAPVKDRLLFDLFTTAFNENATRGRLSVNTPSNNLAAWSAVFSGIEILANSNSFTLRNPMPIVLMNVSPAGAAGTASPLGQIVAGIDRTRAAFQNPDGLVGIFEHKGDILAVPQLSEQSPFIYTNNYVQFTNANDQMYEWLPQQAMSLLSGGDQPTRYMIYCWGQSLQPAPGGVYLANDNFFGMVTNYQVTAETATRAVVRVTPTNAVIESFNLLPPD